MDSPPRVKKVVILGSTGSIGQSAMKVAREIPDRMEVIGIAAHSSSRLLGEQIEEFGVKHACLFDDGNLGEIRSSVKKEVNLSSGMEGLIELATLPDADMVLISIIGIAGLEPALAAIEAGKDIAVASKEILVMAGEVVMKAAKRKGVNVLPVDSEHNAIFQCMEGRRPDEVSRLILTASGGPFRELPASKLSGVTVEEALNHPTWEMGQKITIDSATLFNKGLEMIEARWLFDIEMSRVDVIVHPQSIVHSMVEFIDSSVLAQLSVTDMCFPIQYAVTWPERVTGQLPSLNFAELATLEFEEPRWDDFPALNLAKRAGEIGQSMPAVMNAANEVAVARFLAGKSKFSSIWETVEKVMDRHTVPECATLQEIVDMDKWAREEAESLLS